MDGTAVVAEIRILLVAPVRIHQEGLARLLRAEPGFRLAATAVDARAAALLLAEAEVDVVLLDLTADPDPVTARPDRLHALRRVTTAPVVVLGISGRPDDVVAWAEAGIAGYTTRDNGFDELVDTVRSAASGEFRCQARVAAGLVRRLAVLARDRQSTPASPLTPRELEIAALLEHGCSNKEIAQRLHIQLATVKNHVHNILEKLGVRRRGEAVAALRRHQLV
jgi:two-component system, NarL family, nitrate/nitrite response regulator NarL